MANENLTEAYLLNVPLENDYKNTLYFTSKDAQRDYFKSRKVFYFNNFTYQRKDEPVRIPTVDSQGLVCEYDNLINAGVNYVMYRNTTYSTKWFYGFITDIKYISDGIVEVYIETDVIQTWLFDYAVKSSFVEREHVSDDTIGKHTVPEGIEIGDYVCNAHLTDSNLDTLFKDLCFILASTVGIELEGEKYPSKGGKIYNGIYSGVRYYVYDNATDLNNIIEGYANAGQSDAIVGIFIAPKFLCPTNDGSKEISSTGACKDYTVSVEKNYTLNGYSPKNKKLLTYPYNYMFMSNNNGASAVLEYENFSGEACDFVVQGAICPGCSIRITPCYFKGIKYNDEESINLGKYPICSFNVDMYTNWLTQNSINVLGTTVNADQINVAGSAVSSMLQIAGGIGAMFTGAGALAGAGMLANGLTGGVSGITSALMQQKQHQLMPPQARGNTNCGDVITSSQKNTFHFYQMSIKQEYARICDEYMHMFGYKVNRVKIPNKCHRSRFWYTKTIDVNIDGAIPNRDMQIIKNCYNNGITFWRNATEIQNYALDNVIAITEGAVTE